MNHSHDDKEKVLHRIKIIKGHVEAVERMVEKDAYCLDVVHQSRAIQKALKKLDETLISHHLSTCVVDQIKSGKAEKAVAELDAVFKKYE